MAPCPGGRPLNARLPQVLARIFSGRVRTDAHLGAAGARPPDDVRRHPAFGDPQPRSAETGPSPDQRAIPYLSAIDGLRALAVAAVLIYHSQIGWLPGGFLGVEVFFVISGYLITSLLLADRQSSGRVNLLGFWKRRAKRLLPALFALIVGTLVYSLIFLPDEVASLRWNALAGFGYVSNWYLVFDQQSYFESLGRPSLLRHLWSLAVEEQFYLAWPMLFALVLGRIRRRYALVIVLAGAVASTAAMFLLFDPAYDPSRVYYGTDTRAAGLLFGAALAFAWQIGNLPERAVRLTRWFADAAGVLALAGLVATTVLITEHDPILYRGGLALVALLTATLIAACVHPGARLLRFVLGRQPLVWLGTRSYSVYLWHWPVFMLTRPGFDVSIDGVQLLTVRLAITVALAEVSYRIVEMPVRRGLAGRAWRSLKRVRRPSLWPQAIRPLAATTVACMGLAALTLFAAAAAPPAPPSYLAVSEVQIVSWSQSESPPATRRPATAKPTHRPTPTRSPEDSSITRPMITEPPSLSPTTRPATASPTAAVMPTLPPPLPSPPARVLAVGDSVMLGAAPSIASNVPNVEVDAEVSRQVSAGIQVLESRRATGTLGDVVVVHLGTNGSFTSGEFDEIMQITSEVKRVVFVNLKVPRDWEGQDNGVIAEGVTRYTNAVLLDWHEFATAHPEFFYDDGIHLKPEGADFYAGLIASYTR